MRDRICVRGWDTDAVDDKWVVVFVLDDLVLESCVDLLCSRAHGYAEETVGVVAA